MSAPRFACRGCGWTGGRAADATVHTTRAGIGHVTYVRDPAEEGGGEPDTTGSASRQHYIDTGRYLVRGESAACPATGRTAACCEDQSHAQCYSTARESADLDRRIERGLPG